MLQALGFPDQMVHWIMVCVSTPWFTLSLNGNTFGYFQGFYVRGDRQSLIVLLRAFATFSAASGLEMNCDKSDIYFNGMRQKKIDYVLNISGVKIGSFPVRYLGVPISYKRMVIGDCTRLVEKIVARIRSWESRKLSYAGRLVLVKSVLTQLHSYWTRIFVIPLTVIDRVERICRNYLWSGSDQYLKVPAVAWEKICQEKKCVGLGVVNCRNWNIAMLGKYVWWIAAKADHLWISLVVRGGGFCRVDIMVRGWWLVVRGGGVGVVVMGF
ncbi:uncharacterized protein LOC141658401 [Silene latifolia]|uniref:uncharacterized protein LOC141658401 n=1 Tax=Silene latifolia TaxID=37657 RepID=UPI003D771ECB